MGENKVVLVIDRYHNELRIVVNGRIVAFVWDVTGVDGYKIMRRGKSVGTLPYYDEIQERW